jgi:hypothetical protein
MDPAMQPVAVSVSTCMVECACVCIYVCVRIMDVGADGSEMRDGERRYVGRCEMVNGRCGSWQGSPCLLVAQRGMMVLADMLPIRSTEGGALHGL